MRRESGSSLGTRGVLVFSVGDVLFGAPVEEVAGLIEGDRVTPLPRQAGAASGILAFRGSMIPALDLCAYLDVASETPERARYGIVLSRGAERFAILVPDLPRLVPGRELKEAEMSIADSELGMVIGSVYHAGSDLIHCLHYWSIFDSVMPPASAGRVPATSS